MYNIRFSTEKLGWFSTAYVDDYFGIPYRRIANEIYKNLSHWDAVVTYQVFAGQTEITEQYNKWVVENS